MKGLRTALRVGLLSAACWPLIPWLRWGHRYMSDCLFPGAYWLPKLLPYCVAIAALQFAFGRRAWERWLGVAWFALLLLCTARLLATPTAGDIRHALREFEHDGATALFVVLTVALSLLYVKAGIVVWRRSQYAHYWRLILLGYAALGVFLWFALVVTLTKGHVHDDWVMAMGLGHVTRALPRWVPDEYPLCVLLQVLFVPGALLVSLLYEIPLRRPWHPLKPGSA